VTGNESGASWASTPMNSSRRHFVALVSLLALGALAGCTQTVAPRGGDPSPGLQLHVAGGQDRLVLDGQMRAVRVVRDPERDGIALSVDLDEAAREGVARFTGKHVGERVEIVVAGRSVATLVIRDPVQVPSLLLTAPSDDEVRQMQRDLAAR
jgi:hypothetical protein